jgi:lipopolysaccharide/colanic/teichoic acid biosynthesis glycosyltransferase
MNIFGSVGSHPASTLADVFDGSLHGLTADPVFGSSISEVPQDERQRKLNAFAALNPHPIPFWKRIFDVVGCFTLSILLSPLLLLIALFIRLVSTGPVLFKQVRLGEMGEDFIIYKFRTLHLSARACEDHQEFVANLVNSDQPAAKPDLTNRYIPGGKWLRGLSLDELPQLLNIMRGEMSLIGPRPEIIAWDKYEPWQLKRFEVRPGVTGLWQVSGKNKLTFNQMVDKDIEYISRRSFPLDMWILFRTFYMMLQQDNT